MRPTFLQQTVNSIGAILYELQLFRSTDIKSAGKYIQENGSTILDLAKSLMKFIFSEQLLALLSSHVTIMFILWIFALGLSHYYLDLGNLFVLLSLFVMLFLNLDYSGRAPGTLSAYSVFNEGFVQLPGTLRGEDLDREIRHQMAMPLFDDTGDVRGEIEELLEFIDSDEEEIVDNDTFDDEDNEPPLIDPGDTSSFTEVTYLTRLRRRMDLCS